MKISQSFTRIAICAGLLICSCARTPQETGFLSTYKNLQPESSTLLRYVSSENVLDQYSKFIIDPVVVKFYNPANEAGVTQKDISHLETYLHTAVKKALSSNYQITSQPGPHVARIRIAITDLKPSTPALNILPQTKLLGLGLGEVSIEAEIVDSETNKQIAALVESEQGSRLSFAGLTDWGSVEAIMDEWAHRLQTRMDEVKMQKQNAK